MTEVLDPADDDRTLDFGMGELDGPEPPEQETIELPAEWQPTTGDETREDA